MPISKLLRSKMEESHTKRLETDPTHREGLYWPVHIKQVAKGWVLHYPQIPKSKTGPFPSRFKAAQWYIKNGR